MNGIETIFLDTHVVIWLYQKDKNRFNKSVQDLLEHCNLYISPIVKLELEYLYEIDRLLIAPRKLLDYLYDKIGLSISNESFDAIINTARDIKWTRDPFDRIIVANAALHDTHLISKDVRIRKNYTWTIWE